MVAAVLKSGCAAIPINTRLMISRIGNKPFLKSFIYLYDFYDSMHTTPKGSKKIAETIYPYLVKFLK